MRLFRFFKAVGQEMKQVSWPGPKQTRHDTGTVIGISILFAIFFAVVDWVVQYGKVHRLGELSVVKHG